jgi:hypothetical protein
MPLKPSVTARGIPALALLALSCWPQARAQGSPPASPAPAFSFDQVDAVCVVPVIGKKVETSMVKQLGNSGIYQKIKRTLATDSMQPIVMLALEKQGYRVDSPACSDEDTGSAARSGRPRWILTVIIDGFELFGPTDKDGKVRPGKVEAVSIMLSASLFDAQTQTEVWKGSASGKIRSMKQWSFLEGIVPIAPSKLFGSAVDSVLASFGKKGGGPAAPLDSTTWPPFSFPTTAFLSPAKFCRGTLETKSGTVSFTPDAADDKCQRARFSVPQSQITYGLNTVVAVGRPTAYHLVVPGAGKINFCETEEAKVDYLFAQFGSGR